MPPSPSRQVAIGTIAGVIALGTLAFSATLVQAPGLGAPIQIAQLSVIAITVGVVSLPLVWWDNRIGYALAVLDGSAVVLGVLLYVFGAFGPPRVAPGAYLFLVLGAILVVVTGLAWRGRSADRPGSGRSAP